MADTEGSVRRGVSRIGANKVEIVIGVLLAFGLAFAIGEFVPGWSFLEAFPVIAVVLGIVNFALEPQITPRETGTEQGDEVDRADLDEISHGPPEVPDPTEDPLGTIESQGFDRLTDGEFENRTVDRQKCWRREFNFTEVAEGIPIDRQRPREGHPSVTEELLDDLADGGAVRLTGEPGSGKTTTTRMVAHRWHEREGPVLYRQQRNDPITRPGKLTRAIWQFTDEGPVLVIVEDVARHGTVRFLETLHDLETNPEVSVLINAREREWENLGDLAAQHDAFDTTTSRGQEVLETRIRYPEQRTMPPLHTKEIERLKERFEEVTGRKVTADAEQLQSQIKTNHGVSPMLLLSYHFPVAGLSAETEGHDTALHANVAETYRRINGPDFDDHIREGVDDVETLRQVALLVNVMNAAELPLHLLFFVSVSDSKDDFETVKEAVDALDALLFFGEDERNLKQSHHSVWSELYLRRLLQEEGQEEARQWFETVVNALFEFTAELERRGEVEEGHIAWFVSSIFGIGPSHPPLAPLFSTSEESGIDVPDACSATIKSQVAQYRSWMYRTRGDLKTSREELREAEKRTQRARHGNMLSWVVSRLLAPFTSQASRHEAVFLNERGLRAWARGDYEQAREYHQQSLDIARDLGDLGVEAASLHNLGRVAQRQGDYEQARKYLKQSLDITRDLGDRASEAKSLGNLGLVAEAQGDYDQAREYHRQSLDIARDLGDLGVEATSLTNLGLVAQSLGDYEQAREYHKQSLDITRDLGDRAGKAKSLEGLGGVARAQGDYEQAHEFFQQSLEIFQDLGNRANEAESLNNLGTIAGEQDDHKTARERFKQAAEIGAELGVGRALLNYLENHMLAHENLGNQDEAIQTCERALSVIEESDILGIEAERQRFMHHRLRLDESAEATRNLYRLGLGAILRNEAADAVQWLSEAWERREQVEPDDDRYSIVLSAGVGFAAHRVFYNNDEATAKRRETLNAIEPHRDRLSEPARVLYDHLAGNDPETTPEELRDSLDVDPGEADVADLDLDALETLAYADLLELVQSRETAAESAEVE